MMNYHYNDEQKMLELKSRYIKYTEELKAEIIRLCNSDRLEELQKLIEENLSGKAAVEGTIGAMHYEDNRQRGGFLNRLFS